MKDQDRKQDPQKPAGAGQQQAQGGAGQQYGEGSYSGTKQYNDGLKKHMNQHDIEKEALDAKPRSEEEARQMEEAERIGKSKSKGEDSGMPGTRSGGKE
jgi:hypothetical protein